MSRNSHFSRVYQGSCSSTGFLSLPSFAAAGDGGLLKSGCSLTVLRIRLLSFVSFWFYSQEQIMERRGRMSSMTQCTACPLCLTSCAVPEVSVSSGQSSGIFSADRLVFEPSRSTHPCVLDSPS